MKKILALLLSALLLFSLALPAFAKETDYMITNPYESVSQLLGDPENHYRTNLHTHSTVSDADTDYADMIKGYYDEGFDILGFADHGVLGKYWNEKPAQLPLYLYQYITGHKVTWLTDEEYKAITGGTYPMTDATKRQPGRGLQCVPSGIELNMVTMTKSHVNGYFCDFGQNDIGFENGFEYAVKNVEKAGGISVINHPGDWLESRDDHSRATEPANVRYFGEIFNNYKTCQGMEVFNRVDSVTEADRILWDAVLQYVLPHGERNVWGFANSDAHKLSDIDTSFMDFILPEYSLDNVKSTMMNGNFFAVCREGLELGDHFRAEGAYPTVTSIYVDEENDTIRVTAKNTEKLQWVANGNVILEETEKNSGGEIVSTIRLREHSEDITCYVRFQLLGKGGMTLSQPFVCDDGDMSRFIIEDTRTDAEKNLEKAVNIFKSSRLFVIFQELYRLIAKEFK